MEATSATLLMRLKQDGGAREVAWSEFRGLYAPIIAGFARKLGVPAQEIDDLIQEVLTGFYAAQPKFFYDPSRGRFRGYLRTCVTNLLSRRRERKLNLDGRAIEDLNVADAAIEQAWNAVWENEQLHRAIERVRKHYDDNATFQAFYRVAINEQDPAAVAKDLELSIDSVYLAKSRCIARLRLVMKEIEEQAG